MRSPMFTKFEVCVIVSGSRPERRSADGGADLWCGVRPRTDSAIAAMCAGVVPQHPPTMLSKPAAANSRNTLEVYSGVSSYPPISFGRPAFGYTLT